MEELKPEPPEAEPLPDPVEVLSISYETSSQLPEINHDEEDDASDLMLLRKASAEAKKRAVCVFPSFSECVGVGHQTSTKVVCRINHADFSTKV